MNSNEYKMSITGIFKKQFLLQKQPFDTNEG